MFWVLNILLSFLASNSIYKIFVEYLVHTKAHATHLGWTKEQNRPCSCLNSWLWPTVSSILPFRREKYWHRGKETEMSEKYCWISTWKSFWIFDPILTIMWPINLLRYYGWFFSSYFSKLCFQGNMGIFIQPLKYNFWLKQTEKSQLGWREDSEGGVILTEDVWANYVY